MKARYVCRVESHFKTYIPGSIVAVAVSEKGSVSYRVTEETPTHYLFTSTYSSDMEVVFNKDKVYICQSVESLQRQVQNLTELAESLNNFTLWIASTVVIDDLIMFKVRKKVLQVSSIMKWYERFNKLRALAISTDKIGERDVAIRKAVAVGLRITEGRV